MLSTTNAKRLQIGVMAMAIQLSILAACKTSGQNSEAIALTVDPKPSVMEFNLSSDELARHIAAALTGSVASGHCVAAYYFWVAIDAPDRLYWLQIAAENGDAAAMGMLATLLEKSGESRDRQRTEFWETRSAKSETPEETKCGPRDK
jgi:TPR repeat protein